MTADDEAKTGAVAVLPTCAMFTEMQVSVRGAGWP